MGLLCFAYWVSSDLHNEPTVTRLVSLQVHSNPFTAKTKFCFMSLYTYKIYSKDADGISLAVFGIDSFFP